MSDVQNYIDHNIEKFQQELFEFLKIPSISIGAKHTPEIQRAADFLITQFREIGMENVQLFETKGNPIVYAEMCPHEDRPTVLVYGHYDVQPPDPEDEWETPPFKPAVRENRVYARGASDDKGQSFTHIKALEAFLATDTELPVNLKFILEGEEEIGSPSLIPFIENRQELLASDMVLISDTAMFDEDQPSITYGLRGISYLEILVKGPGRDLHSGVYGGGVANPANILCEILAKLKTEDGVITIPGFYDPVKPLTDTEREEYRKLPFDEERYKKSLGVRELEGEKGYSTLERTTARPTLDINGLWSGYQGEGAKTVLPAKAGAKVSMRLVPDQDPKKISRLFIEYVQSLAPDSVEVTLTEHHGGHPSLTNLDFYGLQAAAKAFEEVYRKNVLFSREGGSIPIVADFKKILGAESILMGFGLARDALHSPNESFSLKDFYRGIRTSAKFLELLPDYAAKR
ncbi:MAG: dipeptidase [Balneolaceae bacterium]